MSQLMHNKISEQLIVPFSPPDITEEEINAVVETLKSGWITTGPRTKQLEKNIAAFCGVEQAVCLNSATAGLGLLLHLFGIKEGDEVITTPYTFAATSNVILHTGAKPVFVDLKKDEFNIDPELIKKAITTKTKAIIPVDFGGWPCDYAEIYQALESKKHLYQPKKGSYQKALDRPLVIADAAHSLGSEYKGKKAGNLADFTVFSFHAVKNLTTAEGGAVTFNSLGHLEAEKLYQDLMLYSLHGQSVDALSKLQSHSWKYKIDLPGYKYNMTDITAAMGLVQLKRYPELLEKRRQIFQSYYDVLKEYDDFILPPFSGAHKKNAYHLFPLRIKSFEESQRDMLIKELAQLNIATNVHFIPLVMQPLYKKLGYDIQNYPNCYEMYKNEITLPLYSKLSIKTVLYICEKLITLLKNRKTNN